MGSICSKPLLSSENIDELDTYGCTKLEIAACQGDLEQVAYLLRNGANPNHQSPYRGNGPLHHAIEKGHTSVVILLLNNNADPELSRYDGVWPTPIEIAQNYNRTEILHLLKQAIKLKHVKLNPSNE
jgi:ankyrin repeat protein